MTERAPRAPLTLPFTVPRPDHWTSSAACAKPDVEAEWWNGVVIGEGEPARIERWHHAVGICQTCPVRATCLDDRPVGADGVWGGKVFNEAGREQRLPPMPRPVRVPPIGRRPAEIEHGEYRGYRMHLRRHEDPCEACQAAGNAYYKDRKATVKAKRAAS